MLARLAVPPAFPDCLYLCRPAEQKFFRYAWQQYSSGRQPQLRVALPPQLPLAPLFFLTLLIRPSLVSFPPSLWWAVLLYDNYFCASYVEYVVEPPLRGTLEDGPPGVSSIYGGCSIFVL